ncbi:glutaminyl-peptide cyclotransferase [Malassezia sp. CBS 17886]|nr:glutaminyl-peptide cyclotransferase [Malassezia sp. CBS 17886]
MRLLGVAALLLAFVLGLCAARAEGGAHAELRLLADEVRALAAPDPRPWLDPRSRDSLLARILIPRVPGTENSTRVRSAIIDALSHPRGHGGQPLWHVDTPSFTAHTPLGARSMTNVVATLDPQAAHRLVLAVHYDSKYFPPGSGQEAFVGATDSAAACALLVDVAVSMGDYLGAYAARQHAEREADAGTRTDDTTLQLVFLDGEEAFADWNGTDSLYGARHLAKAWANSWLAPRHTTGGRAARREIQMVRHFALLDLLGAARTPVPFYYDDTRWLHALLRRTEKRLHDLRLLWPAGGDEGPLLVDARGIGGIEDDHLPFVAEGVPALHVIPWPFPRVWHSIKVGWS